MAKKSAPQKLNKATNRMRNDSDKVREMFFQSEFMDWTRFAEAQEWDALLSRREYPVKTWQEEKRRILAEKQLDILNGLIYERRFKWTHQIIETLDQYPKSIDAAKRIADAKMWEIAEKYKDYVEWRKDGKHKQTRKGRFIKHPFEEVSPSDIASLMRGMKDVTEAKLKALMLDKWAITKLDIPQSEMDSGGVVEDGVNNAHRITIEGKTEFKYEELQSWFDEWHDEAKAPEPDEKK